MLLGLGQLTRLVWRAARLRVPAPLSLAARLENLPLQDAPIAAPVEIRWSAQAIPFITAANLADLATGLGVVHAHLRLGQMELLRRIAQGRICEMIGRAGLDADIALRTIDLGRMVPEIIASLPDATRLWANGFLAGVNHVIRHSPALPPEHALLGFDRTLWTLDDLVTLGRLTAADMTWMLSTKLLKFRAGMDPTAWSALWPELAASGAPNPAGKLAAPLSALARGSNSAAIAASRSASGGAMIASDPHVGLMLPSTWLACGLAAPGFTAAGLMIPGVPYVAIGRNEKIAWGATNLHAASSAFVDLTAEPASAFTDREVEIAVRGGASQRARLRESRFGPVISDIKLLGLPHPTALAWAGHRASDELSAMLALNRAGNFTEFQHALRGFAVQGYSFTYADVAGQVGLVRAGHVPYRAKLPPDLLEQGEVMDRLVNLAETKAVFAPPKDFVVSANEDPQTQILAGFFFAPMDRAARLAQLLDRHEITPADMMALQVDTSSMPALALRDALAERAAALRITLPSAFLGWDGAYALHSAGALAFEAVLGETMRTLFGAQELAPLLAVWTSRKLLGSRLLAAPDAALRPALARAARRARKILARHGSWGEAHRLLLAHPLARLPLIGAKFGKFSFGVPGSNDTLYKTGHDLVPRHGRHRVTYGASARHFADCADPDSNFVVILGGQDGWIGSINAADQIPLWRANAYLELPLSQTRRAKAFPNRLVLSPRISPI